MGMYISAARPSDAEWLDEVIRFEFPYTDFSPEKILSRINDPKYMILVSEQGNIITGFADVELFEETGEARLNAVYVEEPFRLMRYGTHLVKECIKQTRKRGVKRLFLLVKEGNENAKRLYQRLGFRFEKAHDKLIEGCKVEVWSIQLLKEHKRASKTKGFLFFGG